MPTFTYTTTQGDTWDTIAYRLWGQETLMHQLIMANPEYGDVLVFGADITLSVPAINTSPCVPASLPPWMKPQPGYTTRGDI